MTKRLHLVPLPSEPPLPDRPESPTFYIELGKLIIDWKKNARQRYDDIEGLSETLLTEGQVMPLVCVEAPNPNPRSPDPLYELVEGFSRAKGWQTLYPDSWKKLRVEIKVRKVQREGDERLLGLMTNVARRPLRKVDLCRELWTLHRKYGYSVEWIATRTTLSKSGIQTMLRVWGALDADVKKAWGNAPEEVFPWTMIQRWAALPDALAQKEALERFLADPQPKPEGDEPKLRPAMRIVGKELKRLTQIEERTEFQDGIVAALTWITGKGPKP